MLQPRPFILILAAIIPFTPAHSWVDNSVIDCRPASQDIETVIARGFSWVNQHPASIQDGGLLDMIDEAVFYYVIRNLSKVEAEQNEHTDALITQLTAITQLPEFREWVYRRPKTLIDHYHLVLVAHLLQRENRPSNFIGPIVAQAQQTLATTPQGITTVQLTIAAFLYHLGVQPAAYMNSLLTNSVIARMTGGGQRMIPQAKTSKWDKRTVLLTLYALVHEVIAITDFGRLPPPPWLAARQDALVQILMDALHWARMEQELDLVSELVVTIRFLKQPLNDELRSTKDKLQANQQQDGSWGSFNTSRQNKKRHAVLTSIAALRALSDWKAD